MMTDDGLLARMTVKFRQRVCGLHGHDSLLHFDNGRMSLMCSSCGHETPGWDVGRPCGSPADRAVVQPRAARRARGLRRRTPGGVRASRPASRDLSPRVTAASWLARASAVSAAQHVCTSSRMTYSSVLCRPAPPGPKIAAGMPAAPRMAASVQNVMPTVAGVAARVARRLRQLRRQRRRAVDLIAVAAEQRPALGFELRRPLRAVPE